MCSKDELLRLKLINELNHAAIEAIKSNEYNFNDTAIRAKTFFEAMKIVEEMK